MNLNATGRAHARSKKHGALTNRYRGEIRTHNPRSACTNYKCTKKLMHRKKKLMMIRQQLKARDAVIQGRAMLVSIEG